MVASAVSAIKLCAMKHRAAHIKVLFLCADNACLSQMAEAFTNRLKSDRLAAYSAGVAPAEITRLTRQVLAEVGCDLGDQRPKHLRELEGIAFDYAVILGRRAVEMTPALSGAARVVHLPFRDPIEVANSPNERRAALCNLRDGIREFVESLPWDLEHHEEDE